MNDKIRAIIVDDEKLAREELKTLLLDHTEIEVIGEAQNAESARLLIEKENPDVVFLDIQMPGESGLSLAEKISESTKIVFVTAYDEHAIRAFEINALDYLIKPIYPERLKTTIARLSEKTEKKQQKHTFEYDDHIFVKMSKTVKFIKLNTIVCINAAKEYTQVYTNDGNKGLILFSLNEWEDCLPATQFIRIHRSVIININFIDKIEPWFNNSYKVFMRHMKDPQMMSRRYVAKIKDRLGLS